MKARPWSKETLVINKYYSTETLYIQSQAEKKNQAYNEFEFNLLSRKRFFASLKISINAESGPD